MHQSMNNFILYSKESGISMPQIGALFQIHRRGISGVTNIASEIGITSAGASQMLDHLVKLGLIARSEDPHDRRGKQIVLTEKGYQILQESMWARQNWIPALANRMTSREKEQVIAALDILNDKVNQLDLRSEPER